MDRRFDETKADRRSNQQVQRAPSNTQAELDKPYSGTKMDKPSPGTQGSPYDQRPYRQSYGAPPTSGPGPNVNSQSYPPPPVNNVGGPPGQMQQQQQQPYYRPGPGGPGSGPTPASSQAPPMTHLPPQPMTPAQIGLDMNGGSGGGGGGGGGAATSYYGGPSPAFQPPPLTQSPTSLTTAAAPSRSDLRAAQSTAEFALREYMTLQRRQQQQLRPGQVVAGGGTGGESDAALRERLRLQSGVVVRELRNVRREVAAIAKASESHRWRRWLLGGMLASFIPAVRRLFRRPSREHETSNDTEYAFARSRNLIERILDSTHGKGGLASMAFFVFAVLYIFQNEVSLRVAKTVSKRLKRLGAKIERGDEDISEDDMKLLRGWRWRVLLWSS